MSRMIQSVTFGDDVDILGGSAELVGKNTWDDWKILPTERPVVSPPEPKTYMVDIPGGDGVLDLSEAITGYPVYKNREGSFKFRVMNGHKPWNYRYSEIMEYLHGKHMFMSLADDPSWLYEGRFSVESWVSEPTWSAVTIKYNVGPYKWSTKTSIDYNSLWEWNPFNFEEGVIYEDVFKNIEIDDEEWITKTYDSAYFGAAPVSPRFVVENSEYLDVKFKNEFLGIDRAMRLSDGVNIVPEFVFTGLETYELQFRGQGTISIVFRRGRL